MDHTGAFSTELAATLVGVSCKTLDNWHRTDFLPASIPAKRRGLTRHYFFRDVVAMAATAQLRTEDVPLEAIRPLVEHIRSHGAISEAASIPPTTLVVVRQRVTEVHGNEPPIGAQLNRPAALVLVVQLDPIVHELQRKARALREVAA